MGSTNQDLRALLKCANKENESLQRQLQEQKAKHPDFGEAVERLKAEPRKLDTETACALQMHTEACRFIDTLLDYEKQTGFCGDNEVYDRYQRKFAKPMLEILKTIERDIIFCVTKDLYE